jgi:hypothetical protein
VRVDCGRSREGVVGGRGDCGDGAGVLASYGGGRATAAAGEGACVWKRWQYRAQIARAPSAVFDDSCKAPEILFTLVLATSLQFSASVACT